MCQQSFKQKIQRSVLFGFSRSKNFIFVEDLQDVIVGDEVHFDA
jgi:hypothetical protein